MAQNEKIYVTKEGYQDLVNELDNMIHVVRQEVIHELQEARAQGDLSENADYDAARDRQARVEARIRDLESMIANAEIIEDEEQTEQKKKELENILSQYNELISIYKAKIEEMLR